MVVFKRSVKVVKKNIFIIVLVIMVLGLGGFIAYDKLGLSMETVSDKVDNKKGNFNKKDKVSADDKKDDTVTGDIAEKGKFKITYKDEDYKIGNVTNKRNLPNISSDKYQGSADKIVASLIEKSNAEWEILKKGANEHQEIPWTAGVNYMLSLIYENRSVLSFKFERSGAMGGVPWDKSVGYNYDVKTGKMLAFDEVISFGSREKFYDKVILLLQKRADDANGGCLNGDWKDTVRNKMFNDGYWYFTDSGISFAFDRYELACGGFGTPVVTVPYSEIDGYLMDSYKK